MFKDSFTEGCVMSRGGLLEIIKAAFFSRLKIFFYVSIRCANTVFITGLYGDVYLYHDTHLHPSKFFFLLMYVSPDTYNEHVSKQYSYSLIIILVLDTGEGVCDAPN
jgi:hypothetical protein